MFNNSKSHESLSSDNGFSNAYDEDSELPTFGSVQRQFVEMTKKSFQTRKAALEQLIESVYQLVDVGCTVDQDNNNTSNESSPRSGSPQNGQIIRNRSPSPGVNTFNKNSPFNSRSSSYEESVASVDLQYFGEPNQVLRYILSTFMRLSRWCPYEDIRNGCSAALQQLKTKDIHIPKAELLIQEPSKFIPHDVIPPVDDTENELTHSLYITSYIQTCRLEHYVLIMGMHPEYLQEFLKTHNELLSRGSLCPTYRSYICIMAAARHKCNYLVRLMEEDFLTQGGSPQWLKGLKYADPKLSALSEINKVLGHRPWLINATHIQQLIVGRDGWQWSLAELVEAIILICHFHSLATFCLGTGVNLEIDHIQAQKKDAILNGRRSRGDVEVSTSSEDVEVLMEKIKQLDEQDEEITREELNERFEQQKNEATEILLDEKYAHSSTKYSLKYLIDPLFSYQDFSDRQDHIPTFKVVEFTWIDNAYEMINRLTGSSELAELLDRKMKIAYDLTYNTLATKKDVNTSELRRAIWIYIQVLAGLFYDDFDYNKMNKLIERPLKVFIKTATCFPSLTTKSTYESFWKQFSHSEKVHMNILLLEGRNQLELLYGLRAVFQYMK